VNRPPRIGLLPLYLMLYDERLPEMRQVLDEFLRQVADGLARHNVQVTCAPVCRKAHEVDAAIRLFEGQADVDLIVTLHLAYSPSLESAEGLVRTRLPIVMCDTTLDHDFGQATEFQRLLYNHGVHGVQDLASVLRRRGRDCQIVAGHLTESPVLARTADMARAALAARRLRQSRVLRVGPTFAGMGDFAVEADVLRRVLGIHVDQIAPADLVPLARDVTDAQIDAERNDDQRAYDVICPAEVHRRTLRVCLALRRYLERGGYSAFSANFLAFDTPDEPVNVVPFLEASKAMARGLGYAGEGDVLTAALVGALAGVFGDTTFTEIFCPDWKGGSLFISHMGEINPAVAASRPQVVEKPFRFTGALNPAILTCAPRAGEAVLVNLAPGPNDTFSLILAAVESLGDSPVASMRAQIRGWIRPRRPVGEFLEAYSQHGGTHHKALVMGERLEALQAFARFAGLVPVTI
jgi:L-arabinose isomerase